MTAQFEKYLAGRAATVNAELARCMKTVDTAPAVLAHAMGYSLAAGGKRLRPVLLMASAEALGLAPRDVLPAACAIEMIHTYSLIHDDLPAMDNDALRRGKPASHMVYGEACAILAGDALLTLAFETCAQNASVKKIGPARTTAAIAALARAAGACGMVGGQTADIFAEGMPQGKSRRAAKLTEKGSPLAGKKDGWFLLPADAGELTKKKLLAYIHSNKTGALIAAAVEIGALLAGANENTLRHMRAYGRETGLAFQIADDILDVTADKESLGKSGGDEEENKLTFVSLYGLAHAGEAARICTGKALEHLSASGIDRKRAAPLESLARFITERTY
jgi:geranylgeranyl diphosphate synthase type II